MINLLIICFHAAHIGKFWSGSSCAISYLMCISSVLFLILGDGLAFSFLSLIIIIFLIPFVIGDGTPLTCIFYHILKTYFSFFLTFQISIFYKNISNYLQFVLFYLFIYLQISNSCFYFSEYYQIVFLVFLSSYGFFSLSHQPTFSSIPWQAAFVGIPGNFIIQIVPGALVVAHIFASQITTSVALPMLVIQQNYRQSGLSHWTYKLILFHSLKVSLN